MKYTAIALALLLALIVPAFAPRDALALGQPAARVNIAIYPPLAAFHRATQLHEEALTGDTGHEPRAHYGMITLSRIQVIANDSTPDWETIRFLEINLAGSPPRFAYVPAPQG